MRVYKWVQDPWSLCAGLCPLSLSLSHLTLPVTKNSSIFRWGLLYSHLLRFRWSLFCWIRCSFWSDVGFLLIFSLILILLPCVLKLLFFRARSSRIIAGFGYSAFIPRSYLVFIWKCLRKFVVFYIDFELWMSIILWILRFQHGTRNVAIFILIPLWLSFEWFWLLISLIKVCRFAGIYGSIY